jgi:hypothetical protein
MKKLLWWHGIAVFIIYFLSSCASTEPKRVSCDASVMGANGRPCWVNKTPKQGVVVNMPKHIIASKTRETLFQTAVAELAATRGGLGVSQDAIVSKVVEVHNDNISGHSSVTSLATITTANESIVIKAKVKDFWVDIITQKVYMWVVYSGGINE